jgi:hypothetical protein
LNLSKISTVIVNVQLHWKSISEYFSLWQFYRIDIKCQKCWRHWWQVYHWLSVVLSTLESEQICIQLKYISTEIFQCCGLLQWLLSFQNYFFIIFIIILFYILACERYLCVMGKYLKSVFSFKVECPSSKVFWPKWERKTNLSPSF